MTVSASHIAQAGALCGVVAVGGLLIMGVAYVRHARRVRELRAWAGDRPERDVRAREPLVTRPGSQRAAPRQGQRAASDRRGWTRPAAIAAGLAAVGTVAALNVGGQGPARPPRSDRLSWSPASDPRPGQVRVLNAAGVPGLAASAAERLAQAGLLVTGIGNASRRAVSHIAAGTDDRPAAVRVARALDVKRVLRSAGKDSLPGVDIVVTIGRDAASSRLTPP